MSRISVRSLGYPQRPRLSERQQSWEEEIVEVVFAELLPILSGRDLDEARSAESARQVLTAPADPELSWAVGLRITEVAIYMQLIDFVVEGDKLDEIHEKLSDEFEDPLPEFPYQTANALFDGYFEWLGLHLQERGFAVVSIDPGMDDQLRLMVINESDAGRLVELVTTLGLNIALGRG